MLKAFIPDCNSLLLHFNLPQSARINLSPGATCLKASSGATFYFAHPGATTTGLVTGNYSARFDASEWSQLPSSRNCL